MRGDEKLVPVCDTGKQLRLRTSPSLPAVWIFWPGAARSGLKRPSLAQPRLEQNAMRSCAEPDWVAATLKEFLATDGLATESSIRLLPAEHTTRNSGCIQVTRSSSRHG